MSTEVATPAQGDTPTGSAPASTPNTPATPAAGNPTTPTAGAPATPAAPAAPSFTYKEDRGNWVPPHRIRESSERAKQLERELDYERRRVAALSGVAAPAAPEDPETSEIKAQFFKLFPWAKKLADLAPEKLEALIGFDPSSIGSAEEHYWNQLGAQTLASVEEKVAAVYGADLTPFARGLVRQGFAAYISSSQELRDRYEQMDPKLVDDFVKEYTAGVLDPHRRSITAAATPRVDRLRRLPRGSTTTAIPGAGPARPKPADTDEYHRSAFAAFTGSRE